VEFFWVCVADFLRKFLARSSSESWYLDKPPTVHLCQICCQPFRERLRQVESDLSFEKYAPSDTISTSCVEIARILLRMSNNRILVLIPDQRSSPVTSKKWKVVSFPWGQKVFRKRVSNPPERTSSGMASESPVMGGENQPSPNQSPLIRFSLAKL